MSWCLRRNEGDVYALRTAPQEDCGRLHLRRRSRRVVAVAVIVGCGGTSAPRDVDSTAQARRIVEATHYSVLRLAIEGEARACAVAKHAARAQVDAIMPATGEAVYLPVLPAAWSRALEEGTSPPPSEVQWNSELVGYADGYAARVTDLRDEIARAVIDAGCRKQLGVCLTAMQRDCAVFDELRASECPPMRECTATLDAAAIPTPLNPRQ